LHRVSPLNRVFVDYDSTKERPFFHAFCLNPTALSLGGLLNQVMNFHYLVEQVVSSPTNILLIRVRFSNKKWNYQIKKVVSIKLYFHNITILIFTKNAEALVYMF